MFTAKQCYVPASFVRRNRRLASKLKETVIEMHKIGAKRPKDQSDRIRRQSYTKTRAYTTLLYTHSAFLFYRKMYTKDFF